jgi:hypothetical protein
MSGTETLQERNGETSLPRMEYNRKLLLEQHMQHFGAISSLNTSKFEIG